MPTEVRMSEVVVPLFPLGVVLFPGMMLPLHIFEPRYRDMVRHCIDEHRLFGVLLAGDGPEPCSAGDIGTLAAIQECQALPDGRFDIVTVGVSRFRVLEFIETRSFLQARVETLPDTSAPDDDGGVREAFLTYLRTMADLTDTPMSEAEIAVDPGHLSYHVASTLPVEPAIKQRLLELETKERLARERALLEDETEQILRYAIAARQKGYFFFNGRRLSLN
jgi:Lon protease-like protein